MRRDPFSRKITVHAFFATDFGSDRKFELVGGALRMMTGASPAHARVASKIFPYLHGRLRGSGCRAYDSDRGGRVNDSNLRYSSVSVFFGDPHVTVVLPGSTAK